MFLTRSTCINRGLGQQAVQLILEEAIKVAEGLGPGMRGQIHGLVGQVEQELGQLVTACRQGEAESPRAVDLARNLAVTVTGLAGSESTMPVVMAAMSGPTSPTDAMR